MCTRDETQNCHIRCGNSIICTYNIGSTCEREEGSLHCCKNIRSFVSNSDGCQDDREVENLYAQKYQTTCNKGLKDYYCCVRVPLFLSFAQNSCFSSLSSCRCSRFLFFLPAKKMKKIHTSFSISHISIVCSILRGL